MTSYAFKKITTLDPVLNQVQDQLVNITRTLDASPILDAVIIQNVQLSSVAKLIPHKLGRTPVGFFAFNLKEDVRVWQDETAFTGTNPKDRAVYLNLVCSVVLPTVAKLVDIYVF